MKNQYQLRANFSINLDVSHCDLRGLFDFFSTFYWGAFHSLNIIIGFIMCHNHDMLSLEVYSLFKVVVSI